MVILNSPDESKRHCLFLAGARTIMKISKMALVLCVISVLRRQDAVLFHLSPYLIYEHWVGLRNA